MTNSSACCLQPRHRQHQHKNPVLRGQAREGPDPPGGRERTRRDRPGTTRPVLRGGD